MSWQLRSVGPSSQCAPVGPSSARWNHRKNDMPAAPPNQRGPGSRRGRQPTRLPSTARAGARKLTRAP
jgi:hypothetical protein